MSNLRLLHIRLDLPMEQWELPALRGAIARQAKVAATLFHNHDLETGGFHYRYPLIQYKWQHGAAWLLAINEGIEAVQAFFAQTDWQLRIGKREVTCQIADLQWEEHALTSLDQPRRYHLRNWLALNEDNYESYQQATGLLEQIALLERLLNNHLVAFSFLVPSSDRQPIHATILELKDKRWVRFKSTRLLAFSVVFEANIALPKHIGLGKGVAMGWGLLQPLGKVKKENT